MLAGDGERGLGEDGPMRSRLRLRPRSDAPAKSAMFAAARGLRLLCRAPAIHFGEHCVERIPIMNPADVAQSALPVASSDVSLIALFWQAHIVVNFVMLGLLSCSVWVWAIASDKTFLYARTKRAMDRFEQAFWSGQAIDDLYRALSAPPPHSMAALFVAAMREWKRSIERHTR